MLLPHTFIPMDEEFYKVRKHYYRCFTAGGIEVFGRDMIC